MINDTNARKVTMSNEKEKIIKSDSDENYREYVRKRLNSIAPVIQKVSLGEFDEKIDIPEGVEDEFTELLIGLNLMIDDLRFMFSENSTKTEELERRFTELSVFNEVGQALGSTLKLDELLDVIYAQTSRVMDTESFYIALYNEKSQTVEFPIFIETDKRTSLPPQQFGRGLTEYIITTRKPLLIRKDVTGAKQKLGIESVVYGDPALCWLGVPMISQEKVIGVMTVQSTRKSGLYDEDHKRLLSSIANQAVGAVANARAYQEVQRRVGELAAFNEVGRALGSTLKLEERLRIIYEQARRVMPADHFYVALYHPASDDMEAEVEFVFYVQDGHQAPSHIRTFNNGFTEHVIKTGEPLFIQRDLRKRVEELGLDVVVLGTPAKSWLGVPLVARDQVVGVMAVQSIEHEEAYDEGHKAFLISLASQASGAIDNARAYRKLENRLTELSVLNEISRTIGSTLDVEELYGVLHEQIIRLMDAGNFYIALYDSEREEVSFPYALVAGRRVSTGEGEWATRCAGHGMTEYVIQTGKPQLVQGDSGVELDKRGVNHIGKATHSWIGAPMIARNQVIGVVALQAFDPDIRYTPKDMRFLQLVANQAAPAVENARAYQELENNLAELKRAEEALREREELYRTVVNTSQEAIILVSVSETILFVNPAAARLFGCTAENLRDRSLLDFIPEEEKQLLQSQTVRRMKGETSRYELTVLSQDGSTRRVLVNAAPLYDAEGEFQAGMAILTDITELSVINEIGRAISSTLDINELYVVLHEQTKRLMDADNFYIALYDKSLNEVSFPYSFQDGQRQTAGEGEWVTRRAGNGLTEHVIQTAESHLVQGDSEAEVVKHGANHMGKPASVWMGVPMVVRNEVIGVMAVQAFEMEITYSEKDIDLMQTVANQAAQAVENARAYSVLEQRVQERTADLAKSNDALEDFVYTVSHDLKAPLRAILGFSQFLVEDFGSELPDEGKMYLERMSQSAKRMELLINDLLELSRVGRVKNPYEETDIDQLISETISTLAPDEKVSIQIEGSMPGIVCDRVRIGQVFANLISNAVKYNDKENPVITIAAQDTGEEIEFQVADNGPGIEERHFEKIFKIFQRLSSDGAGTGIGLALVKKIVEDHKGRIWLESEVGKGSTFKFTLPRIQKSNEEEE